MLIFMSHACADGSGDDNSDKADLPLPGSLGGGVDIFAQMMGGGDDEEILSSSQGSGDGDDIEAIARQRVRQEMSRFAQLRMPKAHTAADIMELYSANRLRFPAHVLALREACSARGTSADVEAIFSRSGSIMRARRSRLHADKLTMLMMIISNRSKMPKVGFPFTSTVLCFYELHAAVKLLECLTYVD